jgi:hypothetical protein
MGTCQILIDEARGLAYDLGKRGYLYSGIVEMNPGSKIVADNTMDEEYEYALSLTFVGCVYLKHDGCDHGPLVGGHGWPVGMVPEATPQGGLDD